MEITRRCNRCEEMKLLTEFHRKPTGKYGRMAVCAECVNLKRRLYRSEKRRDVTIRVDSSLRDRLTREAKKRDVPNKWLANHLLAVALYQLEKGNVSLPETRTRRRHD